MPFSPKIEVSHNLHNPPPEPRERGGWGSTYPKGEIKWCADFPRLQKAEKCESSAAAGAWLPEHGPPMGALSHLIEGFTDSA